MGDQLKAVGQLHQLAQVHDADAVGDVLDHAQVMGDEQVGQAHFLLQVLEHIHDLCLNGHVQCGDRLVTDDELGVHSQCTGNAHALTLAAGELVAVAVCVLAVQAHALQQGDDLIVAILLVLGQVMDVDAFTHDVTDGHAGVQACVGVLEHDLHPAAVGQHIHCDLLFLIKQQVAIIVDLTAGGLVQAQQGAAGGGLATAGLAHQTHGSTTLEVKGDAVHGLHMAYGLAYHTALDGEVLLQILDLQNVLGIILHRRFNDFLLVCHGYSPTFPSK